MDKAEKDKKLARKGRFHAPNLFHQATFPHFRGEDMFFETLEDVHLAVAKSRNERYTLEDPDDVPFWTLETVFAFPSLFLFLPSFL